MTVVINAKSMFLLHMTENFSLALLCINLTFQMIIIFTIFTSIFTILYSSRALMHHMYNKYQPNLPT